jgi:hypothetical protein
MFSTEKERTCFAAVLATFPATFGLSAFPGETFRISEQSSYFNGPFTDPTRGTLMLYTERLAKDGTWLDFAKGTECELRRQIVRKDH